MQPLYSSLFTLSFPSKMKENLLSLFTINKMYWVLMGFISTLPHSCPDVKQCVTIKCQSAHIYVCVCVYAVPQWSEMKKSAGSLYFKTPLIPSCTHHMYSSILEGFISILKSMHWMDTFKSLTDRPGEQELLIQYLHVTWPQLEIAQASFLPTICW